MALGNSPQPGTTATGGLASAVHRACPSTQRCAQSPTVTFASAGSRDAGRDGADVDRDRLCSSLTRMRIDEGLHGVVGPEVRIAEQGDRRAYLAVHRAEGSDLLVEQFRGQREVH